MPPTQVGDIPPTNVAREIPVAAGVLHLPMGNSIKSGALLLRQRRTQMPRYADKEDESASVRYNSDKGKKKMDRGRKVGHQTTSRMTKSSERPEIAHAVHLFSEVLVYGERTREHALMYIPTSFSCWVC